MSMNPELQRESELLTRSWEQHEASWLRDYLVAGVEDPRLNLQSILTRHFLIRAIVGERFAAFMHEEYYFSAAMNWLGALGADVEERTAILHALRHGADNAEGILIPPFMLRLFARLPCSAHGITVLNYIEKFLEGQPATLDEAPWQSGVLNTFCGSWSSLLAEVARATRNESNGTPGDTARPSVLEPACGSANDYRYIHAFGIGRLVEYTGFDLSAKNIENARALFPGVHFAMGNVFELNAPDKAFDFCIVQDLFEHLSLAGLEAAVREICRVTRMAICAGFFQMDETPEHLVRPLEDYYWNRLSMARTTQLFAAHGFAAQVFHMDSFLREQTGCDHTHNPYAYTFVLRAR